ncbi:MAG: MFS transporter [Acidobacteriia bacterium]|nr:MFS transporter [Terriglobia bacterium]
MFRALRHRNFQLFFGGQLISLVGTWMQMLAQSWLVYRLTHSAALLGEVGFASQIPVLFLGPVAGIFADRHSRQRIVIVTQTLMMIQALVMAALTLTHTIKVWEIFVLALFLGICNAFDIPARQSFIVEMVGSDDLMNAIALNSSTFNAARSIGPAVAGILVGALGEGMCFLLNGLSFIAVIAGLLMMRIDQLAVRRDHAPKLEQFREGFVYVRGNTAIRTLLLLLGIVSLLGMSYTVLMPIFADKVLHSGAGGLGELLTSAGVGALIGALWLARRQRVLGLDRVVGRACAGFGASLILFSLSRILWLSLLLLVPAGFFIMTQLASTNTLIQSTVSNTMRGRVMGIYSMMFLGLAPFGSLIAGFMAQHLGAPVAVFFCGSASMIAAAIFSLRRPALRIDDHLMQ